MSADAPVALVTGAAGAIGIAVAVRLAADGYDLVLNDIDAERLRAVGVDVAKSCGGRRVETAVADVSVEEDVERMFGEVEGTFGRVDVLVNAAGQLRNAPLVEMTSEQWDDVVDVHLKGTFLCSRAAVRMMTVRGGGRIVNISSGVVRGSDRGHANYAGAKAGVIGLTTALAVELGPLGVRVNAVAPGAIVSELTRQTARQLGQTFEEYAALTAARIPLRRIGEPEDVAAAVAFFAAPGGYTTGQVLFVSGGP